MTTQPVTDAASADLLRPTAVVSRSESALTRRTLDGMAILGPNGDLVCLDDVGAAIWAHLDGPTPVEDVLENVAAMFAVGADETDKPTLELLDRLVSIGALRTTP